MEQVLIGGFYDLLHITDTEYNGVVGNRGWFPPALEHNVAEAISTSGKLKSLRVELNDVPGTGTYTFTLRRAVGIGAFANTALTCTVGAAATQANDMVNEVAVSAGDIVTLECNPDAPDNARYAKWSMVFEGDTANESLLPFTVGANRTATRYAKIMGSGSNTTAEDAARTVCPTSGTIKNLYVVLKEDPGTAPDAYIYTLRINGANSQDPSEGNDPLQVTIVADGRTGSDTLHEIPVSAGDILTMRTEPIDAPPAEAISAIGMTFVADIDGESLILGNAGVIRVLDDTLTEYNSLIPSASFWTTTEAEYYQLAQLCTLKKLYILLSGSPGASKKYTFTVRRNDTSPASGLVVEIAGAATTGNDTGNEVTIANDDELDLMVVPDGTPTVRDAYWGLVGYIEIAVTEFERSLSTSMGLSVSLSRLAGYQRPLSTAMGMSVTLSRALTYARSLATAIGLLASLSRAVTYGRSLTTAIGLTATLTRVKGLIRSLTTTMGLSVALSRAMTYGRSLSTSMGLVASLSKVAAYSRSLSTAIGLSVTLSSVKTFVRNLTASMGMSVTLSRVVARTRSLRTSMGLAASLAVQEGYARSLTTAIGFVTSLASRYWGNRIVRRIGDNRTISSIGTNRNIQGVGTNRDISGVGTNRDISTVGDNRDVESF